MARMVVVCLGCMTEVVDGGPGNARADGGALCPKCGSIPSERVMRMPEGRL